MIAWMKPLPADKGPEVKNRHLRAILFLIFMLCGAFACIAGTTQAPERSKRPNITVDMTHARSKTSSVFAAWILYALVRSHWQEEEFFKENPDAPEYRYTFKEELEGRTTLSKAWAKVKKDDQGGGDQYLDALVTVYEAGFLPEYVWYFLRDQKWGDAPDALRLEDFDGWRSAHLANHTIETIMYPGKSSGNGKKDEKTATSSVIPVPGYTPPGNETAKEHYRKGLAHQENREYDAAIREYLKAIEGDPEFTDAMDNLGLVYRMAGKLDEAERWYDRSLSIRPNNVTALGNLAVLYRFKGMSEKAVKLYKTAVEIAPQDPEPYYGLGCTLHEKGDFAESIKYIDPCDRSI